MFIVRVVYRVSILFIIVGNFRKIFFSKDLKLETFQTFGVLFFQN